MATISVIHNLGEHFQEDDNNDWKGSLRFFFKTCTTQNYQYSI